MTTTKQQPGMDTILNAPFTLSREQIRTQLAIKPGSYFDDDLEELLSQVEEIAKPKAIYRVSYIEDRTTNTVTIDNTTFNSPAMSTNLDQIRRVFPFIATCGKEIDEFLHENDDLLKQYWLNSIKLVLLQAGLDYLRSTLISSYRLDNLSTMNPGSGEARVWPIEEQSLLFSLFGGIDTVKNKIGVQLKPSYLMVPEMSVSGILFPGETSYYNCQLCQRKDCPGRQAHFNADMWESIHGNS